MKLIIDSFVNRDHEMPSWLVASLGRFLEMGYDPIVKINPTNQKNTRKHGVAWNNFLSSLKKYKGEDLLIAEDDCYVNVDYDDLKQILEPYKNCVVRVVYNKNLKNPAGSNGRYIIGNQLTYIPKEYQEYLISIMDDTHPCIIDCWFSRSKRIKEAVLQNPLGKEIEHYSYLLGKVRTSGCLKLDI